jgi:hypothetical protein
MSYNYGNITCNNLSIEHGGNQALMTTISQTTNDELNIDGPVIIDGDLQVTGVINATVYGGATIDASGGNGTYDYASIVYEDGNITNIISNTIPTSATITADSNTTYNYANITYQDGNITDITSNPTPGTANITVDNGTYDYATITVDNGNITEIVSNTIPASATITADSNTTYNYANITYEDGNITNITSNPTPGTANITVDDGTYDYATITVANGNITSMVSNTSSGGYALLAGGSGSSSQIFTGYNQFNHGITLYNPQYLTSVSISSWGTTENTLSIQQNINVPQKVTCNILEVASYISLGHSGGSNYIQFYDGSQQTVAYTGIPATVDCTTVNCTTVNCTTVNTNNVDSVSDITIKAGSSKSIYLSNNLVGSNISLTGYSTSSVVNTGSINTQDIKLNSVAPAVYFTSTVLDDADDYNEWYMVVSQSTNPYCFNFYCPGQQSTTGYSPQWNFISPSSTKNGGIVFAINNGGGGSNPVIPTVAVGTVTLADNDGTMEISTSNDVKINGISFKATINRLNLIEQRLNHLYTTYFPNI